MTYISRHIPVFLEGMPIFQEEGPYVLPSWAGMAIWATTPAFLYSLFVGQRDRRVVAAGAVLLGVAAALIISRAMAKGWDGSWGTQEFPLGLNLWPFYGMIALAVLTALRRWDRLAVACWAAVVGIGLGNFTFAATGWSQFGYRYALDFYPFLFILTMKGMGGDLKWHQKTFIAASVVVNLWAVLWVYHFEARDLFGWEWVRF
jgi:hypothetical protein